MQHVGISKAKKIVETATINTKWHELYIFQKSLLILCESPVKERWYITGLCYFFPINYFFSRVSVSTLTIYWKQCKNIGASVPENILTASSVD